MPDQKGKVNLVRKDGSKLTVNSDQAAKLRVLGYREETPEESINDAYEGAAEDFYTSPEQKVLTASEGWLSGASAGVSDVINPDKEGARERAQRNPGTRIGSEIAAGVLEGVILPGSRLTGAKAIAYGAAEGTVFGAGSALSQSALSGDPLTATSVLTHAGIGALLGTGVTAAAEGLISGAGKLKRAASAGEEFVPGARNVDDDTLSAFYKSLPADKTKATDKVPLWEKEASNLAGDVERSVASTRNYEPFRRGVQDVVDTTKIVEKDFEAALNTARAANKEYLRGLESTAADLNAAVTSTRKTFRDMAESDAEKLAINAEFQGLEDGYRNLRRALKENDPVKALNKVERFKESIKSNPNFRGSVGAALPPTPDSKLAVKLRDTITATEEMITMKAVARELRTMPSTADEFFKMKGPRAEKLFAAMDKAGGNPELSKAFDGIDSFLDELGIKTTGSPGLRARAAWETGTARTRVMVPGKEVRSLEPQYGPSRSAPEKPLTPSGGEVQYKYKEGKDEFLPEFVSTTNTARGSTNYARSGFWGKVARLGGARQASQIGRKMGGGAFGSAVAYEVGAGLTGMLVAGVAGAKAATLGRVASAVGKYGGGLGKGLKRIAPRIDPLTVRIDGTIEANQEKKDKKRLFKERTDEIMGVGPSFKDTTFMAVQPLVGTHPEFAASIHDVANTAFTGLLQFIPRDPGLAFSRLKSLWKPTDLQVSQFQKAYAVYHDPVGTIEAILDTGYSDMITVAALKTMYPPLYQELQTRLWERLADPQFLSTLSYSDQARLSILSGIDIHSSFSSRSIAQTQMMYQRASENRPVPPAQSSGGANGRPAKQEPPTPSQSLLTQ